MGKEFLEFFVGEADQGQTEEEKLIFQIVPLLLGFLQEGFVFVVLGILGEEKAGIKKGLYPIFLDGFLFFQSLKKSGRGEKGKIRPFISSLKLPGPFHSPVQVVSPGRLSGSLVEIGQIPGGRLAFHVRVHDSLPFYSFGRGRIPNERSPQAGRAGNKLTEEEEPGEAPPGPGL